MKIFTYCLIAKRVDGEKSLHVFASDRKRSKKVADSIIKKLSLRSKVLDEAPIDTVKMFCGKRLVGFYLV